MNKIKNINNIPFSLKEIHNQNRYTNILIDGSYFCYYEFYNILSLWKKKNLGESSEESSDEGRLYRKNVKDKPLDSDTFINNKNNHPQEYLFKNDEFINFFENKFISSLKSIPINLNISNNKYSIIVAKDCSRNKIWRLKYSKFYKQNRNVEKNKQFHKEPYLYHNISQMFYYVYHNHLFIKGGANQIVYHRHLEADDCIALKVFHYKEHFPHHKNIIISSDSDYLQLISSNVDVVNMKFERINQYKKSTGDPKCDLFCKIVVGDTSDNIPSIFTKCGIKNAIRYFNNPELFSKIINENIHYSNQFYLNKILIDFNCIPNEFRDEFYSQNHNSRRDV